MQLIKTVIYALQEHIQLQVREHVPLVMLASSVLLVSPHAHHVLQVGGVLQIIVIVTIALLIPSP